MIIKGLLLNLGCNIFLVTTKLPNEGLPLGDLAGAAPQPHRTLSLSLAPPSPQPRRARLQSQQGLLLPHSQLCQLGLHHLHFKGYLLPWRFL